MKIHYWPKLRLKKLDSVLTTSANSATDEVYCFYIYFFISDVFVN